MRGRRPSHTAIVQPPEILSSAHCPELIHRAKRGSVHRRFGALLRQGLRCIKPSSPIPDTALALALEQVRTRMPAGQGIPAARNLAT